MRRARGMFAAPATLVVALVLIAGACKRDQAQDEGALDTTVEPRVEVTGVQLGRAVGPDKRVTDETSSFRPLDTIYVSVATEGSAQSANLSARWTYQDGQVVDETTHAIAPSGAEVTEFHVAKPDGWPAGNYEVVISLDGRDVERKSFTVEAGT